MSDVRRSHHCPIARAGLALLLAFSPIAAPGAQTAPPLRTLAEFARDGESWNHYLAPSGRMIIHARRDSVFIRTIPGQRDIPLTIGSTDNYSWSARSDRVAWIKLEAERVGHVWTAAVDPATGRVLGRPQRVSVTPASGPSVSADGKWIAYVGPKETRRGGEVPILVVSSTGGPSREIARLKAAETLMWGADGRSIYLLGSTAASGDYALLQVSLDGRAVRTVRELNNLWVVGLSQNGSRFAAVARSANGQSLVVLDTLGNELSMSPIPVGGVTQAEGVIGDSALVWHVARESRELTVHNVTTQSRRNMPRVGESDLFGTFSPDGRLIAHIAQKNGVNAVVIRGSDGANVKVIAGTDARADAFNLKWSPDSRSIGFVSRNNWELRVVNITDGRVRTLKSDTVARVGSWVWRSDSRGVNTTLLVGNDLSKSSIESIDLDGTRRKIRQLNPTFTEQIKGFRWLNDTLIVVRHDTAVFTRTFGEGDARLIAKVPTGYGAENLVTSRDDRMIVTPLRKRDELGKLEVLTMDGSRREIALPIWFLPPATPRLSPDGRMAYVTGRTTSDPSGANIYAVAVDGSSVQRIANITGTVPQASFDLSPDGKSLLYPSIVNGKSTLMIVPFKPAAARSGSSPRR